VTVKIRRLIPKDDPETRVYFSRTELTKKNIMGIRGEFPLPNNSILTAVLEIPGVAQAGVQPYCVVVGKAPTYEWPEIEPSVVNLLSAFNIGEGRLEELSFVPTEAPDDISPADLGKGFRLTFQRGKGPNEGKVRAVVKDSEGKIIASGPIVDANQAIISRRAVLESPERKAWDDTPEFEDTQE
jgi:hypothetical protein